MNRIFVLENNRPGMLADVSQTLELENINIRSLTAHTIKGYGFIILTVDQYDRALQALMHKNYVALSDEAIPFILKDEPGALAKIALRLKEAQINIQSLQFLPHNPKSEYMIGILSVEQKDAIPELLQDVLLENWMKAF